MWSVFLQATDKVIAKINHSAQQMRSLLSTELQPLIKNKRGAGVAFTNDRVKAENDYNVSSREVDTLHQQYKDNAKATNKCKRKMKKNNEKWVLYRVVWYYGTSMFMCGILWYLHMV